MLMERDSRRSKAYIAERRAFKSSGPHPLLPLAEMDQFCRKVLASKRVQTAYELPANLSEQIEIRAQRGGGAQAWMRVIQFGAESCKKWIALHELAHVIQSYENHTANVFRRHRGEPEVWDAAHGQRWAKIYLDLVRRFLGLEAETVLKAAFATYRVRYRKPRSDKGVRREMPAACRARWTKNGGGQGHGID